MSTSEPLRHIRSPPQAARNQCLLHPVAVPLTASGATGAVFGFPVSTDSDADQLQEGGGAHEEVRLLASMIRRRVVNGQRSVFT